MSNYYLGLDLGQSFDYSALAILERQGNKAAGIYHCRFLKRWPLRTPYPEIVSDVARILDELNGQANRPARPAYEGPSAIFSERGANGRAAYSGYMMHHVGHAIAESAGRPVLAIDATGVGLTVANLFSQLKAKLSTIFITGGDAVTQEDDTYRVPKLELVGAAQVALQTEKLKIAEGLAEAQTLIREMLRFQVKVSLSASPDTSMAWREGDHDGLVLAVALALWIAENQEDRTLYVSRPWRRR